MTAKPAARVSAFLRSEKDDLVARNVSRSKVALIDRLLSAELGLADAWGDLLAKCPAGNPPGMNREYWQIAIDRMIDVACFHNPEKIRDGREALKLIAEENQAIATKAAELAKLLRKRDRRKGQFEVFTSESLHPVDLLQRAANLDDESGFLFDKWVWPGLDDLRHEFDLKYWPTAANLLDALAQSSNDPRPADGLTAAALAVNQAGIRDFMRALDEALDQLAARYYSEHEIVLSQKAYAALCNALLGLDEVVTEDTVKSYRAQKRKR